MSLEILAGRAMSAFPLSIGTSLAMESIYDGIQPPYDPERVIPQKVKITDYQDFWFNLSTLFRNIVSSVPAEHFMKLKANDIAYILSNEIDFIMSLVAGMQPMFYVCEYKTLFITYKNAHIRTYTTPKQKKYKELHDKSIQMVLSNVPKGHPQFTVSNMVLKPKSNNDTLILTHMAHDLLYYYNFNELHLIESNTGVLRKRDTFYKKYYRGEQLPPMPMHKLLLQVLGDKNLFHPQPRKIVDEIVNLAVEKRWTYMTTNDKIRYDIGKLKNRYLADLLLAW